MMHKKYQRTRSTARWPKCKLVVNSLMIYRGKEPFLDNQFLYKPRQNRRDRDRTEICQT